MAGGVCGCRQPWPPAAAASRRALSLRARRPIAQGRLPRPAGGARPVSVRSGAALDAVPLRAVFAHDHRGRERDADRVSPAGPADRRLGRAAARGHRRRRPPPRRSGPEGDFYGVREWRSGDGRRLVHWRSSARLGKLVVRQFERPRSRDLAVVLDLWQPETAAVEHLENVERAVSFAATVLTDLCRQGGSSVYLALGDPGPECWGGPASPAVVAGPDGTIGHRRSTGRRLASRLVGRRLAVRRRRRRDRRGQHAAGRSGRHHAVRRPLVRSGPARPCTADPVHRYVERQFSSVLPSRVIVRSVVSCRLAVVSAAVNRPPLIVLIPNP